MDRRIPVYGAAMTTVVLWAMSYVWADRLLGLAVPVEYFVPVRILLAGGLLFCLNKLTGKDMRLRKGDGWRFGLLALCMPFIYFIAETYGLSLTDSPTITSLVVATNPVFAVAAGMLIFKEKFSPVNFVGVAVTLAGLALVVYTRGSTGPYLLLGILVLLVAVISEVSQIAFTKALSARYAPSVIVMYQFLFGAVFFLPLFLTRGLPNAPTGMLLSWKVVYPILALALLCSATAFTTWAFAIKHLGVAHTSVFLAVVPPVTALMAFLFGDESLTLLQWLGLAVAMGGIILTQWTTETKPQ